MGGPRLELFRFASYVFLPVAAMAWYGNPEWYEKHVKPLRDGYLQPEKADVHISETPDELQQQLAVLKAERLQRRQRRAGDSSQVPAAETGVTSDQALIAPAPFVDGGSRRAVRLV